jgi:hypothetical protein
MELVGQQNTTQTVLMKTANTIVGFARYKLGVIIVRELALLGVKNNMPLRILIALVLILLASYFNPLG